MLMALRVNRMNWYKMAQQQSVVDAGPGKIPPEKLGRLYYFEKQYSQLLQKKMSGQELSDEEYKKIHVVQEELEKVAHDLGNQFYEISELIQIVNNSYYHGEYVCSICWSEMEKEEIPEEDVTEENRFKGDLLKCPECGLEVFEDDWQDLFGVEHTDYGGGFLATFQWFWDEADGNLNKEIIALHYIINAIHGSGRLIHLFMDKTGGDWVGKMKQFLDALSAGDVPKESRNERGRNFWDFQLDYGQFEPDFIEGVFSQ